MPTVRPELGEMTALKCARHPVAELSHKGRIVPNDVVWVTL